MAFALNVIVSLLCSIAAVIILQTLPPRHRWSRDIAKNVGTPSGTPIYRVKLMRPQHLLWKRRKGPIDAVFRARVAVAKLTNTGGEHIVEVPVIREWRPVLGHSVSLYILPQLCNYADLRYFPAPLKEKRLAGSLCLEDLLGVNDTARLRIYVFAYRRYTGTRWMRQQSYVIDSIKPGNFKGLNVEPSANFSIPRVEDLLVPESLSKKNVGASTRGRVKEIMRIGPVAITISREK